MQTTLTLVVVTLHRFVAIKGLEAAIIVVGLGSPAVSHWKPRLVREHLLSPIQAIVSQLRDAVPPSSCQQPGSRTGIPKLRAGRACTACHAHKIKCSGDSPECKRCKTRGITCDYKPRRKPRAQNSSHGRISAHSTAPLVGEGGQVGDRQPQPSFSG